MRLKTLFYALLVALFALPVLAQDSTPQTVAFDGFSFSFPSALATGVNITRYPGDPTTLDQPGGPEVAHTQFVLYTNAPAPETFYEGAGGVRVYNTADFAGYDFAQQQLQLLQTLIAQRPDLAQYMTTDQTSNANNLPFLPVAPAAQVIRARAQYVDTGAFSGVSYVTVYRQDVSPFVGSDFRYVFEGISADGSTLVSANFPLTTTLFPAEVPADFNMDNFAATFNDYLQQSVTTLNSAAPTDFTPSLATLDTVIQSFAVGAMGTGGVAVLPPTIPAPTATAVNTDPTLGGLANSTWVLTSYGSPDNPQPALGNPAVTLTFSADGVGGNGGCNSYGGSFQYDSNSLTIGGLRNTLMACDQPILDQETAYLTALQTATGYQINGSQLQISYDGGVLNFTAADALSGAAATPEPTAAG